MTTSAAAAGGRVLFFGHRLDSLLLTYLLFFLSSLRYLFFLLIRFSVLFPIFSLSLRWTIMMRMKLSDNVSGD
jgi:hypothetical protein